MAKPTPSHYQEIQFTIKAVAEILNVSILTVKNREAKGIYPPARRGATNSYRYYTLFDVFHLQELTFKEIYPGPIHAALYDKGIEDANESYLLLSQAQQDYLQRMGE